MGPEGQAVVCREAGWWKKQGGEEVAEGMTQGRKSSRLRMPALPSAACGGCLALLKEKERTREVQLFVPQLTKHTLQNPFSWWPGHIYLTKTLLPSI